MHTVFAMSVLPVPEGPAMRKLATGRFGFDKPLLESLIAFASALTASGCPTTLPARTFSILSNFSFSEVMRRVTGMFVHFATISAICSGVTMSVPPPAATSSVAFLSSSLLIRASTSGMAKNSTSEAVARSYLKREDNSA